MSKISVNELSGAALDYAVALAMGKDVQISSFGPLFGSGYMAPWFVGSQGRFSPTTGPAGDALIDREKIATEWCWSLDEPCWQARIHQHSPKHAHAEDGATRREAAMRCYVASKLGAEVEIPEELA